MKIALYVDDMRKSIDDENFRRQAKELGATIIIEAGRPDPKKVYDEAMHVIENSWDDIVLISLDHDLGEERTGYDLAKEMARYAYFNEVLRLPEMRCHSANPIGWDNITRTYSEIRRHHNYMMRQIAKEVHEAEALGATFD